MKILVITNKRKLNFDTKSLKTQSKGGTGVNIFNLIGKKLQKGEEILSYDFLDAESVLEN